MNKANSLEMFLTLNAEAFKKGLGVAGAGMREMARGTSAVFARTKDTLKSNVSAIQDYNSELGRHGGVIQSLRGHIGGLVATVGASLSIMAGMGKLVEVTREFDKLSAGLVTATGSAKGSEQAFEILEDFAANTPYDLAQVTDSFIKLVNFGLNPSQRALTSYGNTSSALGKDLNQMIEAVADAATGEFERLKEFGIKSQSEGDKVTFTFRGISTTVGKTAAEIEEYLIRLGETNFGGAMANRMSTLDGALSNLGDSWDSLFRTISKAGIGDEIAKGVRIGTAAIDELIAMIASGELLGYLKASADQWSIWGDEIGNMVGDIGDYFDNAFGFVENRGAGTVNYLITAFRQFPENVRAFIGLVTVMAAAEFDKTMVDARAFKDGVAALFNDKTLEGVLLERNRQRKIIEEARDATIDSILNERSTAIESTEAQIAAAKKLRAEYDATRAAGKASSDDRLAQFKAQVGGMVGAMEKGGNDMEKAVNSSTASQVKITDARLKEMKKAYQDYADTVKKLQAEIAGREQDLAAQLREMGRSGMSDLGAWKDRKREAEEYGAAAKRAAEESKKAFAVGDTATGQAKAEQAVQLYDKAKDAAADLNREVKAGDTVIATQQENLKTAMGLVEEYGRAGIEEQKKLKEAITQAATALDEQTGGKLAEELPEVAKQFGQVTEKAEDLTKKSADFNTAWNGAWEEFLNGGNKSIEELESALAELTKDRHITVYVKEVEQRSTGGLIGYMRGGLIQALATGGTVVRNILAGGFLPGFGGGDTVPLMGERGEVMINKDAVQEAGLRAALAFNAKRWNVVISELLKMTGGNLGDILGYRFGGLIGDNVQGVQALTTGDPVQSGMVAAASGGGNTYNTFNYTGPASRQAARDMVDTFFAELERRHRGRS